MCLEGGRSGEAQTGRAAEKNLLQYQARCFLVAIPSSSSTQKRRRRPPKNLLYWHGDSHDGDLYITHTPQVTAALPHMATYTQRRSLSSYRPQAGPSPSHTDHLHHTYATDDHPPHPSLVSTERERERERRSWECLVKLRVVRLRETECLFTSLPPHTRSLFPHIYMGVSFWRGVGV